MLVPTMFSRGFFLVIVFLRVTFDYFTGSKRGQADGFGIDILPKLKDVKSKDTSVNLLHYTVQQYIKKYEKNDAGTDRVKLPLPDPSDLNQGTQVNFTELEKELRRIQADFEGIITLTSSL